MPKILLYITAKVIWNFLFWNTDYYENRAHVHVGKRSTEHLCKIWLEPIVEVEDKGDLTDAQVKEILKIATDYREKLLVQWELFKQGRPIRIIRIKKTK
jgi:hypothetical protein